jgi:hypothetical protein
VEFLPGPPEKRPIPEVPVLIWTEKDDGYLCLFAARDRSVVRHKLGLFDHGGTFHRWAANPDDLGLKLDARGRMVVE